MEGKTPLSEVNSCFDKVCQVYYTMIITSFFALGGCKVYTPLNKSWLLSLTCFHI